MPSPSSPLPLERALQLAIEHQRNGRLAQAADILRQVLVVQPNHAGAAHLLAITAGQSGDMAAAEAMFRRSLELRPREASFHSNYGRFLAALRRWPEAAAAFQQANELLPRAEGYADLAMALRAQGLHGQERQAYEAALRLNPNVPEVWNNFGGLLLEQGQADQALTHFKRAVTLNAGYVEAHTNSGLAHLMMHDHEQAIACYRQALALNPKHFKAHYQMGVAFTQLCRWEAAVQAFSRAVELVPEDAAALNSLGNALKFAGRYDESIAAYQASLKVRPDSAETWSNLASMQQLAARHDEWRKCAQRAVALAPGNPLIHGNYLNGMIFDPAQTAASIAAEHARYGHLHGEPLRASHAAHGNDRSSERPLRVGFVSPDFGDHVVGRNILPLFRERDRSAFHFTCYSGVALPDGITEQFRAHADAWVDVRALSDDAAAEKIRADGIDILVDLTLHMSGNRLGIFARKPAPVQVTFAGYPGTTGLHAIDYRLTDPHLDPPARGIGVPPMSSAVGTGPSGTISGGAAASVPHVVCATGDAGFQSNAPAALRHRRDADATDGQYAEHSIRLPHSFWCYDPLGLVVPVNELPCGENGAVTFGCLNNFCKTNDVVLGLWGPLMARVANSRLLLLARPGSHRQHVLDTLGAAGIAAERIEFVTTRPRREYLEYFHRIDISLDTVPYNGHTTSLDSLWMGVPVVTLVGETVVGRAGLSQLSNLGMPELIAWTAEEYVEIATRLAADRPRLGALRQSLRERMEQSVLMDAKRWTRGVEAALCAMWQATALLRPVGGA